MKLIEKHRENKRNRMNERIVRELGKLGWERIGRSDLMEEYEKFEPHGKYVHCLDVCRKHDVDTKEEKPAEIYSYNHEGGGGVSLTAREAWLAVGIAVSRGWRVK